MKNVAPRDASEIEAIEQREWLESLDYVVQQGDRGRVQRLLASLRHRARSAGVSLPFTAETAYVNTLRLAFANVVVYTLNGQLGHPGHATFVIAASDGPVQALPIAHWTPYTPDEFSRQFIDRVDLILTDDHAPVDTLLQPALNDR